MKVSKDTVVTVRARTTDAEGAVIQEDGQPLSYLHGGYDDIFPKIEAAFAGKSVGEAICVRLAPADAFGDYDAALVRAEGKDCFPNPPQLGELFELADAPTALFRVVEIKEDYVILDGNHPLAGLEIVFSATITDIRPATAAECAKKSADRSNSPDPAHSPQGNNTRATFWWLVLLVSVLLAIAAYALQ